MLGYRRAGHRPRCYTFDANGNQRTIETPDNDVTTYSWSYENQLIQIEEPDDTITTNIYGPVNRNGVELRISTETDAGIVQFIYDDQNIIQELDDTNAIEAEYSYNPQPYGDLVSQRQEDESSFYNFDALGSTQSLTDESGTKTDEYAYNAFGKELHHSGTTENKYTWIGQLGYYREENGLYLLRERFYSSVTERFNSEDPLKLRLTAGTPFAYASNAPVTKTDPSGLLDAPQTIADKIFDTLLWQMQDAAYTLGILNHIDELLNSESLVINDEHHEFFQELNAAAVLAYREAIPALKGEGPIRHECSNRWQKTTIFVANPYSGEPGSPWIWPTHRTFDTGWWLNGAHRVTVRITYRSICLSGKFYITGLHGEWTWYDNIDGRSAIEWYNANKGHFFETWGSGIAQVGNLFLESIIWDLIFDKLLGVSFPIEINSLHTVAGIIDTGLECNECNCSND